MPKESRFQLGYYFFAPRERFVPCGMFSTDHIVASIISIVFVAIMLLLNKKRILTFNKIRTFRISAILLTILEAIKISHSFIYGDYGLDNWFPLSFCGLFILALWMAGFCKNKLKRIGEVYLAYGCPFAGVAFLIFPTTSLMLFPVWHYFSIYSLFFHSLMVYVGFSALLDEERLDRTSYLYYLIFFTIFAVIAIILNTVFGSNLMILREPFNIPIQSLQNIYMSSQTCYTLVAIYIYLAIPLTTIPIINAKRKFKK